MKIQLSGQRFQNTEARASHLVSLHEVQKTVEGIFSNGDNAKKLLHILASFPSEQAYEGFTDQIVTLILESSSSENIKNAAKVDPHRFAFIAASFGKKFYQRLSNSLVVVDDPSNPFRTLGARLIELESMALQKMFENYPRDNVETSQVQNCLGLIITMLEVDSSCRSREADSLQQIRHHLHEILQDIISVDQSKLDESKEELAKKLKSKFEEILKKAERRHQLPRLISEYIVSGLNNPELLVSALTRLAWGLVVVR